MKASIASTTTTIPNQQITPQSQEVPIIGNGGAGIAIAIIGMLIGKWMPWGDLAKQFVGTRTSTVLMSENRKNQEIEGEIDINMGMSSTLSDIARQGVTNSAESIKELHHMLKESLEANASHSKSSELLLEAKEHHAEATNDLAKAMQHLAITIESLTQAQKLLPQEIAVFIDTHAKEMHVGLDSIDNKLHSIEKAIASSETRIIEQYTGVTAQLRRDLKDLKTN
jgi:hypothetical protein